MKNLWRLWAKALGEKAGVTDREADLIAWIRTTIVVIVFILKNIILSLKVLVVGIQTLTLRY
jgi:hypothetical protein